MNALNKLALKFTILVLAFGFSEAAFSQNFEWLRTFKSTSKPVNLTVNGICSKQNGGSVVLVNCNADYSSSKPDSIFLGAFKFLPSSKFNYNSYLVELDSGGKVVNANYVGNFWTSTICKDNNENIYLAGVVNDTNTKIGNTSLDTRKGILLFAKYDRNLNFLSSSQTGGRQTTLTHLIFSEGNVFFICISKDTTKIGTKTYLLGSGLHYVFGSLDTSNLKVKWSNCYLTNAPKYLHMPINGIVRLKNRLFISGMVVSPVKQYILVKNDTFHQYSGFVIEADSVGNYLSSFRLRSNNSCLIECLATDGEHLYFGGEFMDTVLWGTKKIKPEYPSYNKNFELFAASIDLKLNPRWFFRPSILNKSAPNLSVIKRVISSNGYLYFSSLLGTKIVIDSNILDPRQLSSSATDCDI
jgi:hypothetical protein